MHADPVARPQYFDIRLGRPKRRARHGERHEPTAGTGYTSHHHRQDDVDHERVHRRAAEIPDALRKAVHRGEVCESCDDLVMNAVATAASGVGPVQLRHNVWPHVRIRLPAPGGVSSIRRTGTVLKGVGRLARVGCFNALATTACSDREACESNCSASINVVVLKNGVCRLIRMR